MDILTAAITDQIVPMIIVALVSGGVGWFASLRSKTLKFMKDLEESTAAKSAQTDSVFDDVWAYVVDVAEDITRAADQAFQDKNIGGKEKYDWVADNLVNILPDNVLELVDQDALGVAIHAGLHKQRNNSSAKIAVLPATPSAKG